MRKIDALLNGGGTVDSTSYPNTASASTPQTTTIAQHFPASAAGLSGDAEVEYWKRKIAILSQPVTAEGLAPPRTNYHNQQQQQSNYNRPSFSSSSSSSPPSNNIAQKMQDMSLQQKQSNHSNHSNHSNYSNSPSPLRRQHSPPQQRQQVYQPPQSHPQSYSSQSSPSPRQPNHTFGHKTNEPVRQSPARNQKPIRSPGRGGGKGNSNNRNNSRTQYGQTPSPSNARKSRHHHGEPVSMVPEGFPPTPPGWKRARDKKSGRYYLYRGSETTWETDRTGQRYKK